MILLVLLVLLAVGAVVLAQQRLEASDRERALAERQLEQADRVDPDRA